MNIDFRNNNTFTSRNATIRYADDLARRVNKKYPRLSASKMETLGFAKYYQPTIERLWDKNHEMRDIVENIINSKKPIKEKLMKILYCIQNRKVGNCGESALLTYITAKLNKIDNCKFACLISGNGFDLDHSVILVEDKKPYVIDAWLGFADYIPNAIKKYQNEYKNCFDFDFVNTNEIVIKPDKRSRYISFMQNFSDNDFDF